MIIDIQVVVTWVGAFMILGGFLLGGIKIIDKHFLKRISALESETGRLSSWTSKQQAEIEKNAHARRLSIEAQLVCLEKLDGKDVGDDIKSVTKKIKEFLYSAAGETKSH